MQYEMDTRELYLLERRLRALNEKGVDYAQAQTQNEIAFDARAGWAENMEKEFTLRNRYLQRSPKVERAKPSRPQSVLGSPLTELAEQELGATVRRAAIPTPFASGQAGERTRPVQKRKRFTNIRVSKKRFPEADKKKRAFLAIKHAQKQGDKFVFLEFGAHRGIYAVSGKKKAKIRLVHTLPRSPVRIVPRPTLYPASVAAGGRQGRYWREALMKQIDRVV